MSRNTQPEIASDMGHTVGPAASPRNTALTLRGLTVSYGEKPAVFSVDATFDAGGMSAIVGPNGAGKSTLLKAALGVIPRLSGEVHVFGELLRNARARIAYVPQSASVDWDFPTTVLDVVQMGLYRKVGLLGRLSGQARVQAHECLERVGLLHPERVAAGGAAEDKDGAVAHLCTDERRKRTSVESCSRL